MKTHRLWVLGMLLAAACTGKDNPKTVDPPKGDGFSAAYSVDETTLIISFTRKVKGDTVTRDAFAAADRTVVPPVALEVVEAQHSGDAEITLITARQDHGRTYTLNISGLKDENDSPLDATLNFTGGGSSQMAQVSFEVTDADRVRAWGALQLQVTVDPSSSDFSDRLNTFAFAAAGAGLATKLDVAVNAFRTVDRRDDVDPVVDRRAYAARVVTAGGVPASPLVPFAVNAPGAMTVTLGLLPPPTTVQPGDQLTPPTDPTPGNGAKRVRVVVDDRLSRELVNPAIKCSFDAAGNFDVTFPQQLTLAQPTTPYLYEVELDIRVDPARHLDGMNENDLPYIITLVNDGADVDAINLSIIAPDETPQAVKLPLGDATMTPVQFRIDVGRAYLTADGSQRGVFTGESPFITGEWQRAADALGRNAGDAFTGGEQRSLQMRPDPDHPGLWVKTLWLPPGRPYGWKIVRCQTDIGCGPLNQRVASSGRAFATVMKNLVTENQDAFAFSSVVLVDPNALANVPLQSGVTDYSNAHIYIGNGMGGEGNPANAPNNMVLFKQEVPDLAVVVGNTQLITPIVVVGTWRDVNLPVRPAEILAGSATVSLTPYDYDEGFIGRYPPTRSAP
jgi:hypothetical protein